MKLSIVGIFVIIKLMTFEYGTEPNTVDSKKRYNRDQHY